MNKSSGNTWKIVLIPFSWLYGLAIWIRNSLYDNGLLRSSAFQIPLISVGNITVGGTGKTPHVEYLAGLLKDEFHVATLSRGYKRRTRDFRLVSLNARVQEVGDEPLQIKRKYPEITVAVDRKRVNGVERLMKQAPPVEVILLDDAYQHRSIRPGLSILLMDYSRPIDRDRLLPAGRLREPASRRSRAHIILVTKSPEKIKPTELQEYLNRFGLSRNQQLFFTTMRYGELTPVYPETTPRSAAWFKKQVGGVLIVTGIANPRPLRQYAGSIHTRLTELHYPDHHQFTGKDIDRISSTFHQMKALHQEILVLTTEKDAMRLREHEPEKALRDAFYAIPIYVHFPNNDKDEFDRQIRNYVSSNKRSSILYQGPDS